MAKYKISVRVSISQWIEQMIVRPLMMYRRIRYGYTFRRIALTQGHYAMVDEQDYYRLCEHRWHAQICYNYRKMFLGYFDDEDAAGRAYDVKAKELYGEHANLNFPNK